MIFVSGATGNVGGPLVRKLVAAGQRPRVLTRDLAKLASLAGKVEAIQGDLNQPDALAPALKGVERLFLLAPGPDVPTQETSLIKVAKRAGVAHVVMVSSLGVEMGGVGSGQLHMAGEAELRSSGLKWTLLRPSEFMSNVFMWLGTIRSTSAIMVPTGSGRVGFIDPQDVASVACTVLTSGGHEGKTYGLTGPEALSTADIADKLGAVLSRQIRHIDVSEAAFRDGALRSGVPAFVVELLAAYYAAVNAGKVSAITTTVEQLTGHKPRRFEEWTRENAAAFA